MYAEPRVDGGVSAGRSLHANLLRGEIEYIPSIERQSGKLLLADGGGPRAVVWSSVHCQWRRPFESGVPSIPQSVDVSRIIEAGLGQHRDRRRAVVVTHEQCPTSAIESRGASGELTSAERFGYSST